MLLHNSKIIELIHTTSHKGDGSSSDPFRTIHTFHRKDGELVMAYDPCGLKDSTTDEPKEMKVIWNEHFDFN